MKVTVLMFGALADVAGRASEVDLDEPAAAADVVDAIRSKHPDASAILDRCAVAVNHEVVDGTHRVADSDEVALLPPASGGAITTSPSVSSVMAQVASPEAGGTAVFVGTVRGTSDAGPVTALDYAAYEAMANKVIAEIVDEASEKWGLVAAAVEHAIGVRAAGEITFVVGCAAAHRDAAFDACRYIVDEVKARAPIWKKESGPWGERWL